MTQGSSRQPRFTGNFTADECVAIAGYFAICAPTIEPVEFSPGATKKDGRILVLAAAIITGLRLARDPRAGCQTERVV